MQTFTTTASITLFFGPPPCQHPRLDSLCDIEQQELVLTCQQCRKTIAIPRGLVRNDVDGNRTRRILVAAFGEGFRKTRFPWERIYPCHAISRMQRIDDMTVYQETMDSIRARLGAIAAWIWRYGVFCQL